LEGLRLDMNQFKLPTTDNNLVVEGAGGVLVPINEGALMIDLIDQLDLPVVVVARSGLGTINHTLLTLEALRARNLELLGVIVSGPANSANIEAIRTYGKIKILLELEPISPLDSAGIDIAAKNLESEFS